MYKSYINSKAFEKITRNIEFDISWLQNSISQEEVLKLEDNARNNYFGRNHARDLF